MKESLVTPTALNLESENILFCPNPHLFEQAKKSHAFKKSLKKSSTLAGQFQLLQSTKLALLGPALGAPAAAMALEPVLASKPRNLILLGTCGGLETNGAELFDIVTPTGALSEVGVTKLYGSSEEISFTPSSLHQRIESGLNLTTKAGKVWSTDAPYLESKEKVAHYASLGAIAVDMEFAIVAQLAKLKQIELSAFFVVSDLLGETWTKSFGNQQLIDKFNILCANVNEAIE